MSIRDALLKELNQQFPQLSIELGNPPDPVFTIRGNAEVGDLFIWDDGFEATIGIGKITHGHFNPYDEVDDPEERVRWIVDQVMEFLTYLFNDKILLWSANSGGSGGWIYFTQGPIEPRPGAANFLWSGKI